MNDIDVEGIRHRVDIVEFISRYTQLSKAGTEYRGLCPFHDDHKPSLTVSAAKQLWACFSCGAHEDGADVFGFLMKVENCTFPEALAKLSNGSALPDAKPVERPALKRPNPRELLVPEEGNYPELVRRDFGSPVKVWTIRTPDGRAWFHEVRYMHDSEKQTRYYTWGRYSPDDPPRWECKHPPNPRPFFGLDDLVRRPAAQVMIHEAAKKAEAAAPLFPKLVHLAIVGGVYQVPHMDLAPLAGRRCILLPDNDEVGRQAMMRLAPLLHAAGAVEVKGLDPETQTDGSLTPTGWDIADAIDWTPEIALAWAKARKMDYPDNAAPVVLPSPSGPLDGATPAAAPPSKPLLQIVEGNTLRSPRQEIEPETEQLPAFSEFALADRFISGAGQDWRYTAAWGAWAKWNGLYWAQDDKKSITWDVRNCCQTAMAEHVADSTPAQRMKITTLKTVNAVTTLAGSSPALAVAADQWDADPWLLGTPGGILDLRTGQIVQADKAQMVSKATGIAPVAGPHPWWDRVIGRATGDVSEFLQLWCGYMLTGDTREERFLFIHGPGGAGKSKFLLAISEIMGDYRRTAKMESFTAQSRTEHSEEIARLAGARIVVATETDEGSRWNESRIKALTGRDAIAARHMHRSTFEFKPQFKLVFVGNHRPALRSVGEEMRRRIDLVEWGGSIPEAERVLDLPDKLRAEYPAILAWMIDGCLKWQRSGLGKPASVASDVQDYIKGEDTLGVWLEENTEANGEARVKSSDAYLNFKRWAETAGEFVPSQKRFTQRLKDRGFDTVKSGSIYFVGFTLKAGASDDADGQERRTWLPDD